MTFSTFIRVTFPQARQQQPNILRGQPVMPLAQQKKKKMG